MGEAKRKAIRKFIKKVTSKKRKWSLRTRLKIPEDKKIPMTFLKAIINGKPGEIIKNPTKVGIKKIKHTLKLEQKAIFAYNVKQFKRK